MPHRRIRERTRIVRYRDCIYPYHCIRRWSVQRCWRWGMKTNFCPRDIRGWSSRDRIFRPHIGICPRTIEREVVHRISTVGGAWSNRCRCCRKFQFLPISWRTKTNSMSEAGRFARTRRRRSSRSKSTITPLASVAIPVRGGPTTEAFAYSIGFITNSMIRTNIRFFCSSHDFLGGNERSI